MRQLYCDIADIPAAKQTMDSSRPFRGGVLYADKAYIDEEWKMTLCQEYKIKILTPRKKQRDDVFKGGDVFSSFVSGLRQQIECFFNWLNANTNIQCASRVHSGKACWFISSAESPPLSSSTILTLDWH